MHWGPFAVPAWAPVGPDPFRLAAEQGWERAMSDTPYSEWYWNSISIPGSPAAEHHRTTYGDAGYERFVEEFRVTADAFDADAWADAFAGAGARYVVLVTKHHDGFLLWPSATPNPFRAEWQLERDVVGELAAAVRARNLRFGVYYSGGLDWTFGGLPITDLVTMLQAIPTSDEYARYLHAHWSELVERYAPSVLWNDIYHPPGADDAHGVFGRYYDRVPDGVVNDRFDMLGVRAGTAHADFTTPEFTTLDEIAPTPWETCRGMGSGFGYNRNERDADLLGVDDIVALLADVVSKNGNLLLNVGPMADGAIPGAQLDRLRGVGSWLSVNGDAVYGARPWRAHAGATSGGADVRFTTRDGSLYAIVLAPGAGEVVIDGVAPAPGATVELLGDAKPLEWSADGEATRVALPSPRDRAYTLRVTPAP